MLFETTVYDLRSSQSVGQSVSVNATATSVSDVTTGLHIVKSLCLETERERESEGEGVWGGR